MRTIAFSPCSSDSRRLTPVSSGNSKSGMIAPGVSPLLIVVSWFGSGSGRSAQPLGDGVAHAQRVGDDGQGRVHGGTGDEEAGVDDVEVVQLVHPAGQVQRRGRRVG